MAIIREGVRIFLEVIYSCTIVAMIGKDLKTTFDDIPPFFVHDVDTYFDDSLGTSMVTLEGEWIAIHCMTIEDTDVDIHGDDAYLNFQFIVHMREVVLINNLEFTFGGCTWRERIAEWGNILHYPKAILASMWTIVWGVEALDSSSIHWYFVVT